MKMPNNEQAIVDDKKVNDYLLSDTHETGKAKAKYFKSFGFDITDIENLKKSLVQHANEREVEKNTPTSYGDKYELKCEIQSPDDRNPCIVTVWIIEKGKHNSTLITAYPSK